MSLPFRLSTLTSVLALTALVGCSKSNEPAAPATPKTYTIALSPAFKVGQKFSVVTDLSHSEQTKIAITIPGMPTPQDQNQNTEMSAHIEADGEILAVYPNGSPQKIALTLKSITATNDKTALPNLPAAGAKIVVAKTGTDASVTVNDQPADVGIAKVLRDVFDLGDEKHTDQTLFGPKAPVAIGDTWPVDFGGFDCLLQGRDW